MEQNQRVKKGPVQFEIDPTLTDPRAFLNMKVPDPALVNFPALPGPVYGTEVRDLISGIREGQFATSGQLDTVQPRRMLRTYPLIFSSSGSWLRGPAGHLRPHTRMALQPSRLDRLGGRPERRLRAGRGKRERRMPRRDEI